MSDELDILTAQEVHELFMQSEFDEIAGPFQPNFHENEVKQAQVDRPPLAAASSSSASNRFEAIDQESIMKFIGEQANANTVRKTEHDVKLFKEFLKSQSVFREVEELVPAELDILFGNFLVAVKKADGSDYEPSTIRGLMSSLDRYLKTKYYPHTVNQNPLFPHSNQSIKAKMSYLKANGHGSKPNESDELTDGDIDRLFECGQLGSETPQQVINLLHITFSLVLGMRGGVEQRELKWGDIELLTDVDGDEYLCHIKERKTKTRTGADCRDTRKFKPKAWASNDKSRCPVEAYKVYREHRPTEMMTEDSPFFLSVNALRKKGSLQPWYKNQAMGRNHIYKLVKNMVNKAGMNVENTRKLTNHSVRKHQLQKCVDMGLPPTTTIQLSGHKNLQSINNYSKLNEQQQKRISQDLMTTHKTSTNTTCVDDCSNNEINNECQNQETVVQTFSSQLSNQKTYHQQQAVASSIFQGTTTINGGTFNIYCGPEATEPRSPKRKYRRILVSSDSESD